MAKRSIPGPVKSFTNLSEVLDLMLERGFFGGYEELRNEAEEDILNYDPTSPYANEFWYSNGAAEVKIFRGLFGAYELCNYKSQSHPALKEIFALAEVSTSKSSSKPWRPSAEDNPAPARKTARVPQNDSTKSWRPSPEDNPAPAIWTVI